MVDTLGDKLWDSCHEESISLGLWWLCWRLGAQASKPEQFSLRGRAALALQVARSPEERDPLNTLYTSLGGGDSDSPRQSKRPRLDTHEGYFRLHSSKRCEKEEWWNLERLVSEKSRQRRRKRSHEEGRKAIEESVRLDKSQLWSVSQNYYAKELVYAWSGNDVPFGITTSSFAAEWHANLIKLFCESLRGKCKKCFVLDLGSGHGCFAVRLARILRKWWNEEEPSTASALPIPCVVMTDFHDSVIKQHLLNASSDAQAMAEEGFLDAAVIDLVALACGKVQRPTTIVLHSSATTVSLTDYPVVAIGNYVIDSLPPSVYRKKPDGQVEECRVTCWPLRPDCPNQVNLDTIEYSFEPLTEDAAETETVKKLLGQDSIGLFPLSGANALQEGLNLHGSKYPRVVILGDKMCNSRKHAEEWEFGIPGLDSHGSSGCISCCIDPLLLQELLEPSHCFHERNYQRSFSNSILHFCPPASPQMPESVDNTRYLEFVEASRVALHETFSIADFDALRGMLEESTQVCRSFLCKLSIGELGDLLQLSGFDWEFFAMLMWLFPPSLLSPSHKETLTQLAFKCWEGRMPDWFKPDQIVKLAQWLYTRNEFKRVLELCAYAQTLPACLSEIARARLYKLEGKSNEKLLVLQTFSNT